MSEASKRAFVNFIAKEVKDIGDKEEVPLFMCTAKPNGEMTIRLADGTSPDIAKKIMGQFVMGGFTRILKPWE